VKADGPNDVDAAIELHAPIHRGQGRARQERL